MIDTNKNVEQCDMLGGVGRIVRTHDPCSKCPRFKTTFQLVRHIRWEERICQLSVIPGKRNHEVWSHPEEGPGSHYSISLAIQWALDALRIH